VRVRVPSRPVLACLGVCALIVVVAGVDVAHTESRLPDVKPRACQPDDSSCFDAVLSEQLARERAADPLQDQFNSRAWVYAFAVLATVGLTVAYLLRTRPRTEWPRVFTNLGVTGVWLGIAVVVLLLVTDGSAVKPPPAQALLLPVVLLVAAAGGTLLGRSEGWAERSQGDGVRERVIQIGRFALHVGTAGQARQSRIEELARWLTTAAIALTVATCLLAFVFVVGQPGCDTSGGTPDWTDPIDSIAAVTAIGGMAAGIGTLLLRRWVSALISLVACPVALLFVLASTCAFY
jgi:xanthosine utilization system XapX-like protein